MARGKSSSSKPQAAPIPAAIVPEGKPAPRKKPIVKTGNAGNSASSVLAPREDLANKIFGAWTGKLPLNLLNEHCQKKGWDRPIVDAKRIPNVSRCWLVSFESRSYMNL